MWVLVRLAEMAWRLNDPTLAESHFRQALALDVTDSFLLAAYADFLLDYGRPRDVIALLKDRTRADPLLLRLTLAEQAAGDKGLREHQAALADRYAAARLRGDTTHEQEESRFSLQVLKRPEEALKLAQSNWRVQREPRDARVLMEAALACGGRPRRSRRSTGSRSRASKTGTCAAAGPASSQALPKGCVIRVALFLLGLVALELRTRIKPSDSYLSIASLRQHRQRPNGTSRCAISISRSASTVTATGTSRGARCARGRAISTLMQWRGSRLRSAAWRAEPKSHRASGRHITATARMAVLRFEAQCPGAGSVLDVGYNLFFDLDPQHKGLMRLLHQGATRSAIFSPTLRASVSS
jgi:hypothetical protein